jgi:putative peptidoglycan lipid II flippase
LLADPLARLLFERGEFTAQDAARVARMIACYGLGVWAFCAAPVVVRGYYALGDTRTPLRAGVVAMLLNLLLNLALVWPLAEAGLALATSFAAMLQVALLLVWFSRRRSPIAWRDLAGATWNALLATAAMLAAGLATRWAIGSGDESWRRLAEVLGPLATGGAAFFLAARLLHAPEPGWLLRRGAAADQDALAPE